MNSKLQLQVATCLSTRLGVAIYFQELETLPSRVKPLSKISPDTRYTYVYAAYGNRVPYVHLYKLF